MSNNNMAETLPVEDDARDAQLTIHALKKHNPVRRFFHKVGVYH